MKKIALIILILLLSTSCSNAERSKEIAEFDRQTQTKEEKSNIAVGEIEKLHNIENVNIVIAGNSAIAGIILKSELADPELVNLKNQIEQIMRNHLDFIDNFSVTTAPHLVEKISDFNHNEGYNHTDKKLESTIEDLTPIL